MKSWKGRLYWGMFCNTFGVLYGTKMKYGTLESAEAIANILGTLRSTTLWSTEEFANSRDV